MAETQRQKQVRFARSVVRLVDHAFSIGFEVTFGEVWRHPEWAQVLAERNKGIPLSLHCDRLAIDLNLFRDGKYLRSSESHRPLGEFWKSLGPDHCWGGDFAKPDGNHYSISHGGRK